jgi:dTDP-4-dehydrorhamnose reductase
MESLLITGGAGLLALNWAIASRRERRVVLGLHQRGAALAGVDTMSMNLDSVAAIDAALRLAAPSVVVHAAGLTNVDACEADPARAHQVNVTLAENVARACAAGAVGLVHISTDHVFAGDEPLVDESHPVAPVNVYARTKAEAEGRVLDAHPGALVIRTNFFGWGPVYRPSFSDRILNALRHGRPIMLFADVFFTPVLIETLVDAVTALVRQGITGIVHVAADERVSKLEFGLQLARRFSLDERLVQAGRLADDQTLVRRPRDMSLANAKLRGALGRNVGGIREQLARLHDQEQAGVAKELLAL